MAKDLYTIGETASLLGVSAQTLRFYDRKGILSPVYTDPDTGYRYYSYKQFHIIDRIKYLQGFGLSLEDIYSIISDGTVDKLLPFLYKQKDNLAVEAKAIEDRIKDIEWYINYFKYFEDGENDMYLYRLHQEKRYILNVPCYSSDELSDMEIRLAAAKSMPEYAGLSYRRLYGYKIDFESLLGGRFRPYSYFIYMRRDPGFEAKHVDVLPEGDYICFRTPILKENWQTDILKNYFRDTDKPKLVLALEYEDNLVDWSDAMYEVQILI